MMDNSIKNPLKFYFFSFFAILLVSFFVLLPSFNLAFQDDDWRGVVLPRMDYAEGRFFTPYGPQLYFTGFLYNLFNSNFYLHYILAFILRNMVAFSVLVFLDILTKDRFSSFLGGLLVVVGFSGLQTTYEPANMNVYIAVVGYLVFITSFFLSRYKLSIKHLLIMAFSLTSVTIISPVRTFPLYAWVVIFDIFILLFNRNRVQLKVLLIRQSLIFAIFLILYFLGFFGWFSLDTPKENNINNFGIFFAEITKFLQSLDLAILSNFLRGLGNIIFPSNLEKTGTTSLILGILYLIIILIMIRVVLKRRNEKKYWLVSFLIWPLIFYSNYFIVFLGGYDITSRNTIIFESTKRYLFPPFVGFCIALALAVSMQRKNRIIKSILFATIFLILIHSISTYLFLNKLSKQRDGFYMVKIWKKLKAMVPEFSLNTEKPNVFYFETNGVPREIYTVNDGFIGHMIAVYKIDNQPIKLSPAEISSFGKLITPPIISYTELLSYIKKSLEETPEAEIWNRIFAFRVEGERLIDIENDVRQRVETDLK